MIIFDVSKIITYSDFNEFVQTEKQYFLAQKKALFYKYQIDSPVEWDNDIKIYTNFRNEYRNLIQSILKKTIGFYRKYLPEKCLIAQFGSLAKKTDRVLSDIDFTICYDVPKTQTYECAEELIDYSLSKIFEISIDHIHGKFQHYPEMKEIKNIKEDCYRIQFENKFEEYRCGPETFHENLMNIKNVRDYNSLMQGYYNIYKSHNNFGCLFSMIIIENSTNHNFIEDLIKLESENNICEGYEFVLEDYVLQLSFKISEIKKLLKKYTMVQFYFFLVKLRKVIKMSDSYSMNIDEIWEREEFQKFYGDNYCQNLRSTFISLLFYWNRLELSLDKRKIALSTRCYNETTGKEINRILIEDWGNSFKLNQLISVRNDLVDLIREGLSKL